MGCSRLRELGKTKAFSLSCFGATTLSRLGINGNFPRVSDLFLLGRCFSYCAVVLFVSDTPTNYDHTIKLTTFCRSGS